MNAASAVSACPACGAKPPQGAAFCPACGTRLDAGETERAEVPPHETGQVPVALARVEPRLFGVTPPTVTFALAAVALTAGGFLVGLGHWIWGAVLFAAGLALFGLFLQVARRQPDAALARTSVKAVDSLRARAGYAAELLRTRSSARREVLRRRTELLELGERRSQLLVALGEAAYQEDTAAAEALRAELRQADEQTAAAEQEIARVADQAERRLMHAALEVDPTEILPRDDERQQD